MFRKRFFISGGVYVILTGRDRERFLNIAAGNRLMIFGVRELDADRIAFFTTPEEFKRMKPAARKAGVRLSIKEKYGLPFFLHRNRNRKLMLAGIFTFFILLYVLTLFIWYISIDGNYRFTDEMLLHYMRGQDGSGVALLFVCLICPSPFCFREAEAGRSCQRSGSLSCLRTFIFRYISAPYMPLNMFPMKKTTQKRRRKQ